MKEEYKKLIEFACKIIDDKLKEDNKSKSDLIKKSNSSEDGKLKDCITYDFGNWGELNGRKYSMAIVIHDVPKSQALEIYLEVCKCAMFDLAIKLKDELEKE